jgi:hypothetical protein
MKMRQFQTNTPPETHDGRSPNLSAAPVFPTIFTEVIHTVTSSVTASIHYRFDGDPVITNAIINKLYQIVALSAYSLCKPVKNVEIRDDFCGSLALSTGYPHPLWRAFSAGNKQRRAPDFSRASELAGWCRSADWRARPHKESGTINNRQPREFYLVH